MAVAGPAAMGSMAMGGQAPGAALAICEAESAGLAAAAAGVVKG